ncbi:MAG: HlyD family efflux transporter periplasmic adaptor subunit [Bacteroidetes bacterium]|nr:HlyD family efflux transporter periplasmic adaptor subunit [Bacteroidota bacterium]
MKKYIYLLLSGILLNSCNNSNGDFDASGTFEADEVIVSSETSGRILVMNANEGSLLQQGQLAAIIDTTALKLQTEQVEASIGALQQKTTDIQPYLRTLEQQIEVQRIQLQAAEREKNRIANLVKEDAATTKQLDDLETQVNIARQQLLLTERQLEQQKASINTQNRGILSEELPLEKRKAQLEDQLNKAYLLNPTTGTVLTNYAEMGEMTAPGKALYKIADISTMTLKAYLSGDQLPAIKIGQKVKVLVDNGNDGYNESEGTITWISDKAEFTPKTIQTKEERAHLVYATKIKVKNDGTIKIGMYGEVKF